jgi:ABC-type multidrug transport system ATPase subunit/pSer/pThr/pTyr-binding forkhead associated (FHA) protein
MATLHRDDAAAIYLGKDASRVDVLASQSTVSGMHCRIVRASPDAESPWLIEDLGSTNGTWLHNARLAPFSAVPISEGEHFSMGRTSVYELTRAILHKLLENVPTTSPLVIEPVATEGNALPSAHPSRKGTLAISSDEMARLMRPAPVPVADDEEVAVNTNTNITHVSKVAGTEGMVTTHPPSPDAVNLSFGYADSNDVVIPNAVVSGRHARIYLDGERYLLEDQGSTNGTWLRETRIQLADIRVGDTFKLGSYQLEFTDELCGRLMVRQRSLRERTVAMQSVEARRIVTIGRSSENDIVIPAHMVSQHHATLTRVPGRDGYLLTDLQSTNGTFLNSRDNRVLVPTVVDVDDVIYFGSYRYPVSRAFAFLQPAEQGGGDTSGKRKFVVGREAGSVDIQIDKPQISRLHCEIIVLDGGSFELRDLDSANGTYVNGERIRTRVRVGLDDRVSLGGLYVQLDAEQGVRRDEYRGDIMLQAQRISIDVPDPASPEKTRRILHDISFTAYPTEFVGLMGPSGAGKTTLMMALNGYTPPTLGRSLVNGQDLYENYNSFRGTIGYVPQDDIVFPQLTVYESLWYTARLRLPADTTNSEIDRKISDILDKLEISQTRDVLIGDALKKGISGGQRKRVNLAQELLTEPSLLFLDEPTSGLASEDTINVMRLLRGLADSGKTILLTIHQPSLEAYRMMDNIVYLFEGKLVYYGPAYPDSITYFHPDIVAGPEREKLLADPGNALKALAREQRAALEGSKSRTERAERLKRATEIRSDQYRNSTYHREFVVDRGGDLLTGDVQLTTRSVQKTHRRGLFRQWWILTSRATRIKIKDRVNTAILLIQAPIIAGVLAAVFSLGSGGLGYFESLARGPSALFLLVASAVWFGCSNAAREIVSELAIYRRERMVNLMIPSYVLSKATVLGAVCAIQCAVMLVLVYFPLGLQGNFFTMYGILLLTSWVGMGMGLTLSVLVTSAEAAVALVPLLLIPQIILGGVIMAGQQMSYPMKMLSSLMAARWGYEAMLHVEYGDDTAGKIQEMCEIPACVWGITPSGYQYYPGDPSDTSEDEARSGVEVLVGGVIPPVETVDEGVCKAFCTSLRTGGEITPLERSFGVPEEEPLRAQAVQDIVVEGESPAMYEAPEPDVRAGLPVSAAVLAGGIVFLLGLVMSVLRYRDVEVG